MLTAPLVTPRRRFAGALHHSPQVIRLSAVVTLWLCLGPLYACSDSHSEDDADVDEPFANADQSGDGDDNGPGDDDRDDNNGASAGNGGANDDGDDWSSLLSFPGAGTSDAGDPLPNGMLCDWVPGALSPIPEAIEECYFDKNDEGHTQVAATLEQVLECVEEADTVHLRLTFHPWFVDNTYGENAIGWGEAEAMIAPMMPGGMMGMKAPKPKKGGHTFKDLVGSDHAEIILKDGNGEVVMQFKLDYLSEDASQPSG